MLRMWEVASMEAPALNFVNCICYCNFMALYFHGAIFSTGNLKVNLKTNYSFWMVLVSLLASGMAWGGTLGDFEKEVEENRSEIPRQKKEIDDGFDRFLMDVGFQLFVVGGAMSGERALSCCDNEQQTGEYNLAPKHLGEKNIPFLRADYSYNMLESDVTGHDYRLEAGFGPIAIQYGEMRLTEDRPSDDLVLSNWHVLYRMSFGEHVEVDLGGGQYSVEGERKNTATSFTLPIKIYWGDRFGLEYRPVWTSESDFDLSDQEVSLVYGPEHYGFKIGYRWIDAGHESLKGVSLGFAVFF